MTEPIPLAVHPSEFPPRVRAAALAALRAGRVPGMLLYRSPAQAERWLAYHRAYSPSRADGAVRALYGEAFAEAAGRYTGQPLRYVSLGCGGGVKDRRFLEARLDARLDERLEVPLEHRRAGSAPTPTDPLEDSRRTAYLPLDASPALVMEAALEVRGAFPELPIHPLVADLSAEPGLAGWLGGTGLRDGASTLATCFGMLPNLDPETFPAYLFGLLAEGDRLLVSANLSPGGLAADRRTILAQYDNPEARAWYGGALRELGLDPDAVSLEIGAQPLPGAGKDGSAWRIVVDAVCGRRVELTLFGERIAIAPGHRLRVFHSNRFTPEAAERLWTGARFRIERSWIDPSGEEGIYLCEKSAR